MGTATREQRCQSSMEKTLLAPFEYLSQVPGKEVRAVLIKAFNQWLKLDPSKEDKISNVVRMLHTASLMCVPNEQQQQQLESVDSNNDLLSCDRSMIHTRLFHKFYSAMIASQTPPLNTSCRHPGNMHCFVNSNDSGFSPVADFRCLDDDALVSCIQLNCCRIDDVEDNSDLRRGVPVTHKIYGVPMTINTANFVYFIALDVILKMNDPKLVDIFTDELLNLHRGQGMDLYWRDTLTCPSEEQYLEMVSYKTGGLFRLAVKLMQQCSSSDVDYTELVNLIGAYFQIRDDYMNLQSAEYSNNKGFCEDLTEGKFSFVIVHAIKNGEHAMQLMSILRQKTTDENVKKYAVSLMEQSNSFQYTVEYLHVLEGQITNMIKELGGNPLLENLMEKLSAPLHTLK